MATIEYHCARCSTTMSDNPKGWLSSLHPLRGGQMTRSLTLTCRRCGESILFPIMDDFPATLAKSGWTYRFT